MSLSYARRQVRHDYYPELEVVPAYPSGAEYYHVERRLNEQPSHSRQRKHATLPQFALYGFVMLALVFGICQAARTIVTGVYKLPILMSHQAAVSQYYQQALKENRFLKERIAVYSAPAGIEELARNNLEMVGQDEILVRTH